MRLALPSIVMRQCADGGSHAVELVKAASRIVQQHTWIAGEAQRAASAPLVPREAAAAVVATPAVHDVPLRWKSPERGGPGPIAL